MTTAPVHGYDDEPSIAPASKPRLPNAAGALPSLVLAIGLGLVGILVYGFQARNTITFVTIASLGLLIAGAALLIGGMIGFLFAIPRSLQQGGELSGSSPKDSASQTDHFAYQANTNLEQISDWLTKILVGVGLTQMSNILSALSGMATYIAPALGDSAGDHAFVVALVIYFLLCGFFVSYLWTRLNLPGLFLEADTQAKIKRAVSEAKRETEEQVLKTVTEAGEVKAQQVLPTVKALWVDDRPDNNLNERQLMGNLLGIQFDLSPSTEDAMSKIKQHPDIYQVIITDMSRPGDPQAGYTLLERLKGAGSKIPVVIYRGAYRPEDDIEARNRGAEGITNRPQKLVEMVTRILKRK
jgi:CheY-like chemotaxis protein